MKTIVLLAAICLGSGSCLAQGTAPQPEKQAEKPATPPATEPAAPAQPPAQPSDSAQETFVYCTMSTSLGDIVLELDNAKAPISTANFLAYVDKKFYEGTVFHRVIPTFMIQGGGFTPDMQQKKTEKPIKNEWQNGLKNVRGSIAMARTAVADSATSQFFINVKDNPALDMARDGAAYAVFGKVVAGMATVDKIRDVKTGQRGPHGDVPLEPVLIKSVTRITPEQAKAATDAESKK